MSKAIERFNAERDAELQAINEHYSQLQNKFLRAEDKLVRESNEIKKKTEDRIIAFYREHPEEIDDVLVTLKAEAQKYLIAASMEAGDEPTGEERRAFAEVRNAIKSNPDDKYAKETLQALPLTKAQDQFLYDSFFTDDALRNILNAALKLYLNLLQEIKQCSFHEAVAFIESCIVDKRRIVDEWRVKLDAVGSTQQKNIPTIRTKIPSDHITTTDKLSNTAFAADNDDIYKFEQIALRISPKNSKKEINTLLSIRFDELEEKGVQINVIKRLTPFDRAVYDAVMTLYFEGGNRYMSIEMIHRIMVGNPKARVMEKQGEAIKNSIKKMMHTILSIDATEEGKAYKQDDYFKYTGNLLYAEMVETSVNGNVVNALHIVHEPVLYSYASRTNKIGRISLKLLDTPVSKNEETIVLQDYLSRRILAMKSRERLSNTIMYETIYQQIQIKVNSDGALRNKKQKIRKHTKEILSYWQQQGFIQGYIEKSHKNEKISVSINIR